MHRGYNREGLRTTLTTVVEVKETFPYEAIASTSNVFKGLYCAQSFISEFKSTSRGLVTGAPSGETVTSLSCSSLTLVDGSLFAAALIREDSKEVDAMSLDVRSPSEAMVN